MSRKKAVLVISLVALYLPATYILSGQLFSASERNLEQSHTHIIPSGDSVPKTSKDELSIGTLGPRNSTLGFEKIFYISMPERTDRQDAMSLIASYMDLKFTYFPGVNGRTIPEKALPYNPKKKPPKPPTDAELGCWRAHANLWLEVLTSGLTTALILEDDIDFSTGIRDILANVSTHVQRLTGAKNGEVYGLVDSESWDVISLGHCWNERPPVDSHPVSSQILEAWEDLYAPEKDDPRALVPGMKTTRVRVLQPTYVVVCTQAYAVSRAGAQKLLYHVGGPGGILYEPLDLVLMNLFRSGKLRGYTAVPSIFSQWKNGDSRDTDIQKQDKVEQVEKGSGGDIVNSVRVEMQKVWDGRDIWKDIEKAKPAKGERLRWRRHTLDHH